MQSAAAAGARNQLRREAAWMARQPKARGTKAAARVRAFAELTSRARDLPAGDTRVTFGGAGMQRQARRPPAARGRAARRAGRGQAHAARAPGKRGVPGGAAMQRASPARAASAQGRMTERPGARVLLGGWPWAGSRVTA